jgi:hypothetical protein
MPKNERYSILLIMLVSFLIANRCVKEYSYEGGDTAPTGNDTALPPPPPPPPPPPANPDFLYCDRCEGHDKFEENWWSFKAGNSFVCGRMDTAIMNADRTAFTFFGPIACSMDTSMAVSVYLEPHKLDKSQQGLSVPHVAFYFTKYGLPDHLLTNRPGTPFSFTIDSYDHITKMTVGTFKGNAFKPDGTTLPVEGKFMVRLH